MECADAPHLLEFFRDLFEPFEAENDLFFKELFVGKTPYESLKALPEFFEALQKNPSKDKAYINQDASISPKAHLINEELITIEKGARVEAFAQIEGPCYIGKNVHVGHGASIRAHTVLLEGAKVGHGSEVKASIFLPYAKAAHLNYVGDSFLGQRVNLGAGAVLSNVRLDRKEVRLKIDDVLIPTGLKKLGAILADGCQVGCNATLNPGVIAGKGICIYPNAAAGGTLLKTLKAPT